METVERSFLNKSTYYPSFPRPVNPNRVAHDLEEEIDKLRAGMTEAFLREHSLTANPVIELSKQLDLIINEYMKKVLLSR